MAETVLSRLFLIFAGLLGFSGIALAAAASHMGDERLLGNASMICLAHAPALMALAFGYRRLRTGALAGLALLIGTLLFAGDLVLRHFQGTGLFPMSAPTGGITMMAGWLLVALGGVLVRGQAIPSITK